MASLAALGYSAVNVLPLIYKVFPVNDSTPGFFTFGLFVLTAEKVPKLLLAIPLLWALGGGVLPVSIGLLEDLGMIASGVLGTGMLLYRDRGG